MSRWLAGGKAPRGFRQEWLDRTLQRQESYRAMLARRGRTDLLPSQALHPRLGYRVAVQLPTPPTLPFPVQLIGFDWAWLLDAVGDAARNADRPLPSWRRAESPPRSPRLQSPTLPDEPQGVRAALL